MINIPQHSKVVFSVVFFLFSVVFLRVFADEIIWKNISVGPYTRNARRERERDKVKRDITHLFVTAAVFVTAPAVNVDRDVPGQLAHVIFPPHRRRASGRNPGDELLLVRNPTLHRVGRRTRFAVTLAHRFTGHQRSEWIAMNNIWISAVSHCPIEFVLE